MLLRLALGSLTTALLVLVPGGPAAAVAGCEDLLLVPRGGTAVRATVPASLGLVALPADAFAAVRGDESAAVQARRLAPSEVAVSILLARSAGTTKQELAAGQGAALELLVGLPAGVRISLVVGGDPSTQLSALSADRAAAIELLSRLNLGATDSAAGSLALQQLPAQTSNHLVVFTDGRSPVATPPRVGTQVHRLNYGSGPALPALAGCPSGPVALLPATDAVVRRVQGTYELRVPDGFTEIRLSAGQVGLSAELATAPAPEPPAGPGTPSPTVGGDLPGPVLIATALGLLVVAAVLLVRRRRNVGVDEPVTAAPLPSNLVAPPVTQRAEPPAPATTAPVSVDATPPPVPATPPPVPARQRPAPATTRPVPLEPRPVPKPARPQPAAARAVPVTPPPGPAGRRPVTGTRGSEPARPQPAAARAVPAPVSAPRPLSVTPASRPLGDPAASQAPVLQQLADQLEAEQPPADALRALAAVAPPRTGKQLLQAAQAVDGGAQLAEALDAAAPPRRSGARSIRSELAKAAWALRLARSTGAHPWMLLRAGAEGSAAREDARRAAASAAVVAWAMRACALLLVPAVVGVRLLGGGSHRGSWLLAALVLAAVGAVWVWASTTPPYSPSPLRWRPGAPVDPAPGEVLEDAALWAVLLGDVEQAVSAVMAEPHSEQGRDVVREVGRRVDAGACAPQALHQLADEAWGRVAAERPRLMTAPLPAVMLCLAPAAVLAVLA